MSMNLIQALNELKLDIAGSGFEEGMIEEIAADNDVNPVLLARKFEENFGKAPCDYCLSNVELNYAKIFDEMRENMKNKGWTLHGKMKFDKLSSVHKQQVKDLINRGIKNIDAMEIRWK